ncbi:MAG TPA: phosphatidylserine/phosphatidylglycerophosphate/cardiolipin synthase family protein [Polyangiaceae bacterium]|jgi:cardiolipin synthase|nr:phosphatidylserine/phosphatidylglycerophosphate/cardiolipin synthase family protein [Polyangiaceae bacterium]
MAQNFAGLYVDGQQILPALLSDIAAAERVIHLSIFLFFRDPIGWEVAEALASRARAGVDVRVLLNMEKTAMGDPFSTGEKEMMKHDPSVDYDPTDTQRVCELLTRAGARVQDTNIDYDAEVPSADARLRSVGAQIRSAIAIDELHIDHRKIVIIDGRIAWCGGANIGAQYLFHVPFDPQKDARQEGLERKLAQLPEPWWKWHDSLTRFEGPIALDLEAAFHDRWVLDGGEDYAPLEPVPARHAPRGQPVQHAESLCNEPNDQPNPVRELYLRLIAEAHSSIFIENPYLYHPQIVAALCAAKTKNPSLSVVLIVPAGRHNDNSFSQDAQEHEYERYLSCGIELYEYQNHFNHLKVAVFDERYSIHGSTNLNCRSLEDDKDFELVVLVDDPSFARVVLSRVRDVDRTHSRRISEADLHEGMAGLRRRVRDPRTLLLLERRML